MATGDQVTLSIRPENLRLHTRAPAGAVNVFAGVLERQMFLGEYLECGVRVGETVLVTRQHPSLRLRPGEQLYLELPIELCAVISDTHGVAASAYLGEDQDSSAAPRASSA